MAEIPIQRKTGGGIWAWVIGAIIILALLWFFFARNRDRADVTGNRVDSAAMADTMMGAPAPGMATPPAGTTTTPPPTTP